MKKLAIIGTILSVTLLNAITVYYNGEGDDVGAWVIRPDSTANANLTEVYDEALHSRVMQFTDGGVYSLRMPGENVFWVNPTERILSFDMNLDSDFTISVFLQTEGGLRQIFYNRLNINAAHHNNPNNQNIMCSIGHHRMFRVGAGGSGWGNHPEFRNNRDGWVRVTVDLDRQLHDTEPDNEIISVLSMRIAGTAGRIDNVTLDTPPNIFTRGEVVNDWALTPNTPAGGTVALVQDNPERGTVIEFNGAVGSNSFTAGAREGANRWNIIGNEVIQWKMQTENPYKFIVHTRTANGLRDLVYHGGKRADVDDRWWIHSMDAIEERGLDAANNEIYIGMSIRRHLGDASPDNNGDGFPDYDSGTGPTWQSFTRNVATDLLEFDNMNRLLAINGVTVVGTNTFEHNSPMIDSTIRVDDIQFFAAVVPTGAATHLTSWRRRNNSVRIAFRDNSNGEVGFRFINADTGAVMGNQLPATNGVGINSIGQINGLIAGTDYSVQVETMFNDGRDNIISLPLTFRTTGEAPNVTSNPADDLHFWRRRENSFRISFVDNSEGELGFRFINADTGAVMGNQLNPVAGAGTATIGTINGLTPATTYRVRVETLFTNAQNNNMSAPITVRTLGDAPNIISNPANDLHFWRRRATTIRISFRDNSEGEIGFRYINANTGAVMGNQLNPVAGAGTATIGTINGLTPATTYQVRVETLFANAQNNSMSQPITFTTRAQ